MKKTLLLPALSLAALLVTSLVTSAIAQTTPAPAMPAQGMTQSMPAQASTAPTTPPARIQDPISTALRGALPGREKNTVAAVDAMPADKFTYKPSADQMTFAHLVVHMIEVNYMLCSKAADVPAPKVEEAKDTDTKDKLLPALKASFDFCGDALAKMDDSKLGESTEAMGQQVSRARLALGIVSNWADHYAEASMYLRANGILPPTAKK